MVGSLEFNKGHVIVLVVISKGFRVVNSDAYIASSGLILGVRPANERHRYKVTASLIGWAQTQNQPWNIIYKGAEYRWLLVVNSLRPIQHVHYFVHNIFKLIFFMKIVAFQFTFHWHNQQ